MAHLFRFYVPPLIDPKQKKIILRDQNLRHIKNVLRLKAGAQIVIFDGTGHEYTAELIQISKKEISTTITASTYHPLDQPEITIGQFLPRPSKMDLIVQKITELGGNKIVPISTRRTLHKVTDDNRDKKLTRWIKIATDAACQSGRVYIPTISPITSLDHFCRNHQKCDKKIVVWEQETKRLKNALAGIHKDKIKSIVLLVGPEEGLSNEEISKAKNYGFTPAGLGNFILRTETASIVSTCLIQFILENLG